MLAGHLVTGLEIRYKTEPYYYNLAKTGCGSTLNTWLRDKLIVMISLAHTVKSIINIDGIDIKSRVSNVDRASKLIKRWSTAPTGTTGFRNTISIDGVKRTWKENFALINEYEICHVTHEPPTSLKRIILWVKWFIFFFRILLRKRTKSTREPLRLYRRYCSSGWRLKLHGCLPQYLCEWGESNNNN